MGGFDGKQADRWAMSVAEHGIDALPRELVEQIAAAAVANGGSTVLAQVLTDPGAPGPVRERALGRLLGRLDAASVPQPRSGAHDLVDEERVDAGVVGQLGVEGGRQDPALPNRNDMLIPC